jgi:ABC-type sugar transport system ATPase subunit
MASISLKQIQKSFGDVEVVKGLDLEIPNGQFTVLVGPSGCGKTTTLRMIAGLETVDSGVIQIGDKDVTKLCTLCPFKRGRQHWFSIEIKGS